MSITLHLENFRCWKKKTFTFDKNGIILLSGISGKGKSTILNAIVYVITGNMKNITPIGKEKDHLKVELTIDNIIISRCKNPTRFSVKRIDIEKVYEEDEAQSIIDQHFGSDFKHCSYIDQDNTFSFVYLSPEGKMAFLRTLLLSNECVNEHRDSIKNIFDKTKTEILSNDTTITVSSGFLKKMKYIENNKCILKNMKNPLTLSMFDKVIESLQRNLDISQKNKKILLTKRTKTEEEYKIFMNEKVLLEKRLEWKDELKKICGDSTILELKNKLCVLKKTQEHYKKYKEYHSIKQKLETLSNELSLLDINKENFIDIKPLQKIIAMEEKLLEIQDKIGENNTENIEKLEKQIEDYKKEKTIIEKQIEQQYLYTCPSCQSSVKLVDGKLLLYKDEIITTDVFSSQFSQLSSQLDRKIKDTEKVINVLRHQGEEYETLFDQFEQLSSTIEEKYNDNDYSGLLSRIKKEEQTFLFTKKNKDDYERQLKLYVEDVEDVENVDIDQLMQNIAYLQQQITRYDEIYNRLEKNKESEIKVNSIDFDSTLLEYSQKIKETEEKIDEYTQSIELSNEWKRNEENNIKYNDLVKSIQQQQDAKEYGTEVVKCCEKLLLFVKEAETQSIFSFIESLNHHASLYIEDFFPDEDIKVELVTTKELKSGKDKMGLFFEVQYGTMKGELDFLSGGQRDRVNLAFTLAFSELVQNRILLLDECISSLDGETSDTVIETLHQKYKGKLVICVAHQVNTGAFDQVLQI